MPDSFEKRTWSEEIEVAGHELIKKVKELIKEGNIRRIILKKENGDVLFEIPLTAGVAVGGAALLFAPVLAAVGAIAGMVTHAKIEIIREDSDKTDPSDKL